MVDCSCLKDAVRSPRVCNVGTTILSAGLLIIGTVALMQSCFVPDNDTTSLECASKTTVLFAEEWVIVVLISGIALVLIFFYQILVFGGCTCMSKCDNNRHTVTLSLITGISSTIYVDFVKNTLDKIETSAIANADACYVCPQGHDPLRQSILYCGAVIAWVGFVGCLVISCGQGNSKSHDDLTQEFEIEDASNSSSA